MSDKKQPPSCPKCTGPTQPRFRKKDGRPFFGCARWPTCSGQRELEVAPEEHTASTAN